MELHKFRTGKTRTKKEEVKAEKPDSCFWRWSTLKLIVLHE